MGKQGSNTLDSNEPAWEGPWRPTSWPDSSEVVGFTRHYTVGFTSEGHRVSQMAWVLVPSGARDDHDRPRPSVQVSELRPPRPA